MRTPIWILAAALAVAVAGCGGGSSPSAADDGTENELPNEKVAISVSKFGEGEVLANQKKMECAQQLCAGEFEKDKTVTFIAVPSSGWSFSHWTGCDSSTGTSCEVSGNKSTQIHPYFKTDTAPILHSNVLTLTSETMGRLISRVGDVLTFSKEATQLQNSKVGDILLSSDGEGFGLRITSIQKLRDGNIVVDSLPATLEEIIKEGVLVSSVLLKPQSIESPNGSTAELVTQADGASTSLKITVDGPPKIEGTINLTWNMDNGLHFTALGGLRELKISANPVVTGDLDITLFEAENDAKWKDVPGVKIKFFPFPIGPITVIPEATLVYKMEVGGKVSLKLEENFKIGGSVGVHYVRGVGMNGIGDINMEGKLIPSGKIGAEAGAKVSVGPEVALMILGQAGPTFKTPAYLKAQGEVDLSDSVSNLAICGASASLGLGVSAEAGGELRVFGKNLGEWEFVIFDKLIWPDIWKWPSNSVAQNANCKDTEPPTSPVINELAPLKTSINIKWSKAVDNVRTTGYEIYREGSKIGQASDLIFVDTGLLPGKIYCYRLIAYDAAGNKSIPSSSWSQSSGSDHCVKTLALDETPPSQVMDLKAVAVSTDRVSLNWSDAKDDVQIASYLVTIKGLRLLKAVSNAIEVDKLLPNTEYCFSIYAVDTSGNSSVQSKEVCVTTFPEQLASYTMYLGCTDREWLIEKKIDLNLVKSKEITYTDTAQDYGGTNMIYHLYGSFDVSTKRLNAQIRWTFEGNSQVRIDEFAAFFEGGDTGEVQMTQIQRTGCDAKVRFTPN